MLLWCDLQYIPLSERTECRAVLQYANFYEIKGKIKTYSYLFSKTNNESIN